MAMPSGNVIISDKMPYPIGGNGGVGGVVGGEVHQNHLRQWFPDERDGFISWLRAEFAAANAIIDSLCHHLRAIGDCGEYDVVIGCIQQRRCNWNPILHMQQYFSVAEVVYALQQVPLRRQQRYIDSAKVGGKDFRRFPMGSKQGHWVEHTKEVQDANSESWNHNDNSSSFLGLEKAERLSKKCVKSGAEVDKSGDKISAMKEEKNDSVLKDHTDNKMSSEEVIMRSPNKVESVIEEAGDGCSSSHEENNLNHIQHQPEKQSAAIVPKTFVAPEIFDGKTINVVDGLKLYEDLFDGAEVSKLVSLVNDLRIAGKKGQLQGQSYVVSKRPSKGHGREVIQLGLPILDAPADDEKAAGIYKDGKIEPIPPSIQDFIDRLVNMQVTNVNPDSCIIDFYNEGDHSQPHALQPCYGRPVCILFLTECQMAFGRVIGIDHPGDFRGSLKLSLSSGSLLVMEGNSTDIAKHAIYSMRKQRTLMTLIKSLPKKADNSRISSSVAITAHWVSSPSRSPNHISHSVGHKHYSSVPTAAVFAPAPPIRPHIQDPNGLTPLFVLPPSAMPYPTAVPIPPVSSVWHGPPPPPRHPSPSLPFSGTGVFLPPPVSGNSSSAQAVVSSANELKLAAETENGLSVKLDHNSSAFHKEQSNVKPQTEGCNGSIDGIGSNIAVVMDESKAEIV